MEKRSSFKQTAFLFELGKVWVDEWVADWIRRGTWKTTPSPHYVPTILHQGASILAGYLSCGLSEAEIPASPNLMIVINLWININTTAGVLGTHMPTLPGDAAGGFANTPKEPDDQ
jgi:hypothetical protein